MTALLLTGGFSRGEGTVRDGAPVNDYDLVAVRRAPGGGALAPVAHALTEELGIEVDLMPIWDARLPYVGRKLFWLDLRLGGQVVAGDPQVLARVRRFEAADIHPREPARLLGNRAVGLLIALPEGGRAADDALRDLQSAKALLAAMDARLLRRGLYAPRLRERLALSRGEPDHPLFETAVQWKLGGSRALPDDIWLLSRDALLRAVDDVGARRSADGPAEHAFHLLRARRPSLHPSRAIRREAWSLLAGSRWPEAPAFDRRDFLNRRAGTLQ